MAVILFNLFFLIVKKIPIFAVQFFFSSSRVDFINSLLFKFLKKSIKMGAFRAILELEEKQMNVLFSSVEFSRKTDNKGKPVTSVFGGRIKVTIEST